MCLCYVVMHLQCSTISSVSVHTSQRTQAHKSRCGTLTHIKGMISNMLGIKSKSQGHFQYKMLFNCLVGVLCGPKMNSQHYFLLLYCYEWNGRLTKTSSIIQYTVLNTAKLPTKKLLFLTCTLNPKMLDIWYVTGKTVCCFAKYTISECRINI